MSERPLVLISNDDGILSPHLAGVASGLEAVADVLIVAPERQRSAASHAITLHKPLRLSPAGAGRYALSGTPVDCVYLGMLKLAPRPPAIVVSGPNDGYNLGTDVFYSGTVAAAVEGALRGAVGVAVSFAPRAADLATATEFAVAFVRRCLEAPFAPGTVLNVNVPGAGERAYRWTILGKRRYDDDVSERTDPRGRPYYWIGGGAAGHDDLHGSDCNAVADGVISVTAMHLDLSDRARTIRPAWTVAGFAAVE